MNSFPLITIVFPVQQNSLFQRLFLVDRRESPAELLLGVQSPCNKFKQQISLLIGNAKDIVHVGILRIKQTNSFVSYLCFKFWLENVDMMWTRWWFSIKSVCKFRIHQHGRSLKFSLQRQPRGTVFKNKKQIQSTGSSIVTHLAGPDHCDWYSVCLLNCLPHPIKCVTSNSTSDTVNRGNN